MQYISASSKLVPTPVTATSTFTVVAEAKCCIRTFTSPLFKIALTSFIITIALQVLQSTHQPLHLFFHAVSNVFIGLDLDLCWRKCRRFTLSKKMQCIYVWMNDCDDPKNCFNFDISCMSKYVYKYFQNHNIYYCCSIRKYYIMQERNCSKHDQDIDLHFWDKGSPCFGQIRKMIRKGIKGSHLCKNW